MFNLGVINISYESKELLQKSLVPWLEIRENPSLIPNLGKLFISMSHGCFEETFSLGFPIDSTDGTAQYMCDLFDNNKIDDFFFYETPTKEYEMWSHRYLSLADHIDLLVMVNADEQWELKEIQRMLKFVQNEEFTSFFKINFRNYCINYNTWIDNFTTPRVWNIKKEGGLKGFYQDDLTEWNNSKKCFQISNIIVPNVHPKHLSWVGDENYLKRKLEFQKLRYKTCSYKWNDEKNILELNDEYYSKMNIIKPTLYTDEKTN